MANLYRTPVVYQATIWMDDGDNPMAGSGSSEDFTSPEEAIAWAKKEATTEAEHYPPPEDAPGWYAEINKGHYERDGSTGFEEIDYSWVTDEFVERVP